MYHTTLEEGSGEPESARPEGPMVSEQINLEYRNACHCIQAQGLRHGTAVEWGSTHGALTLAERSCEPESAARPKGADVARDREMNTNRYKSVQIGVQILEK